jgi:Flp pilus assembly protein TadD
VTPPVRRRLPARRAVALGALLAAVTVAVWLPATRNEFVAYDDNRYVTANRVVLDGLTAAGARWALTAVHDGNWIPLTWLSHMLDVACFGTDPAGHHLVSVLLHVTNAVLLFALLVRGTGRTWPCLAAALLFAVHPLRAESVAWVAERKDVLSALFALLTVGAYGRYAARPSPWRYGAVVALFAAGLTAKPMLVSLPAGLLLLDFWPLGRLRPGCCGGSAFPPRRLLLEKLPLAALAAADGAVALFAQRQGGALGEIAAATLPRQAAQAAVSAAAYLGKLLWPSRLAVLYLQPAHLPAWQVAFSLALLVAGTVFALARLRRSPVLATGWSWFLATLAPVAGLVPVGAQAMADRYTYLPQLGLVVALVWGAGAALAHRRARAAGLAAALLAALVLSAISLRQTGYWRTTEILFVRALAVTEGNWLMHNDLAGYYMSHGRPREAAAQLAEAIRIRPDAAAAHANLGIVLGQLGDQAGAVRHLRRAVALEPGNVEAHVNLGIAYAALGERGWAAAEYEALRRIAPGQAERLRIFIGP